MGGWLHTGIVSTWIGNGCQPGKPSGVSVGVFPLCTIIPPMCVCFRLGGLCNASTVHSLSGVLLYISSAHNSPPWAAHGFSSRRRLRAGSSLCNLLFFTFCRVINKRDHAEWSWTGGGAMLLPFFFYGSYGQEKSGKNQRIRENQSTKMQKLTRMEKKIWIGVHRLHTTVQNFACS